MTETIDAQLTAKVAAMSPEQSIARLHEIVEGDSPEDHLDEFAKLIFWPDTTIIAEDEHADPK